MLSDFVRGLFMTLDRVVYRVASVLFQTIVDLANYRLFSNEAITSFSNRIYLILGIVMVFKLIISFIQILINPDNMQDKEKGLSGILKRVVISMLLIVLVRPIFDLARELQEKLLPVIPKVILASKVDAFDDGEVTTSAGNLMAYYSFVPFFYPYPGCEGQSNLGGVSPNGTIYSVNDKALTDELNKKNCPESTDTDGYVHYYQMGISTLVGAFLVYVLVTIALKIAIRAIKLALCEILAPIPIASYIDPKTSKQSFDKWVETSIKTYIDLFTRLAVVYFVIYVFQLLFASQNGGFAGIMGQYDNSVGRSLMVIVFIITGLLYFAKEMPKFITSMLGIPEGFSDIGDMFRGQGFRALRDAGQLLTNPLAVAGSNAVNTYRQSNRHGIRRVGESLRSAVAGATSSTLRSGRGIISGQEVAEAARAGREGAINARRNRATDRQARVNPWTRTGVRFRDYLGIDSSVTFGEQEIKSADAIEKNIGNLKSTLTTLYRKKGADINVSMDNDADNSKIRKNVNDIMSLASDPMFSSFRTKFNNKQLTYDDLLQMRDLAENAAKSGNVSAAALATALSDSDDRMRGIQKAMFTASNRGTLLDTNGNLKTDLNFDSKHPENMDSDLREVYGQMRQTFNSNSATLQLNPNEFNNEIYAMFEKGSGLDDRVKERRAQARDRIGNLERQETAARESLQRRQQNNQQNGGK